MHIAHLMSSQFYGGPERQMLGLALALPSEVRVTFVSFSEEGRCRSFLDQACAHGFDTIALKHDTPHLVAARREIARLLRRLEVGLLLCHGYKANLIGRLAARQLGIPVVAVSRGWTGDQLRVRFYEAIDRLNLRWMDHVVCVSVAQAVRVRRAGVSPERVSVIPNAIRVDRFESPDHDYRRRLHDFFATPRARIVGAAGRLSPEKGFEIFVKAAAAVATRDPSVGFVLFGDGPMRAALEQQIADLGLDATFVLAGFHDDLDGYLPFLDLFVLPSYTEGLPNVVLESFAARVPVVATAVGGTPELVDDGLSGYLVPAGNANTLAARITELLTDDDKRRRMGDCGHQRVVRDFTFTAQARQYQALLENLCRAEPSRRTTVSQDPVCASTR